MPIKQRHLRVISRRFWGIFFGAIIACAVLVQIGRQAFPLMNDYRHLIAESLGQQLGVVVDVGNISADWKGLRPKIILNQLRVLSDSGDTIFNVDTALAELSLIDSFIQQGFAWRTITFRGFQTNLIQHDDYSWSLKGYSGGTANADNPFLFDDPLDIFLFGRRVDIEDAAITFELNNGKLTELSIPSISLENDRFFHRMQASVSVDGQESLTFVMEGYGDPRNKKKFSASGYFRLQEIPTIDIFNALFKHDETLDSRALKVGDQKTNLELWFKGSPSTGMTTSGRLSLAGIPPQLETQFDLPEKLTADISGAWKAGSGWFLNLQDIAVDWGEKVLPLEALSFYGQGKDLGLRIGSLDVTTLINVAIAANKSDTTAISNAINNVKPQGLLKNIDVRLTSKEKGYFLARAFVEQGSSEAFKGSPALANITGYVESTLSGGYVDASIDEGFTLDLVKVFDNPIVLNDVAGQLAWRIDLDARTAYLKSSMISAKKGESNAMGAFSMVLPFKRDIGEQTMSLLVKVDHAAATEYRQYLPRHVPASLSDWLGTAIGLGDLNDVAVFYHGSVSKSPKEKPRYQISGSFKNAVFNYHDDWPELRQAAGTAFIDSDAFEVDLHSANTAGATVDGGYIKLGKRVNGVLPDIQIRADVSGAMMSAHSFLTASPMPASLLEFLNNWSFRGEFDSQVYLTMPVAFTEADIDYRVETTFNNASGYSSPIGLGLDEINGALIYSKSGLAEAKSVQASLWGRPLSVDVTSDRNTGEISVDFQGEMNVDALKSWSRRPELFVFENDFPMGGKLLIPSADKGQYNHNTLMVSTDLAGLALDLPSPLGKEAGDSGHYSLFAEFLPSAISMAYEHDSAMRAEALIPEEGAPSIAIQLGPEESEQIKFPGELLISGALGHASFEEWLAAFNAYSAEVQRMSMVSDGEHPAAVPSTNDGVVNRGDDLASIAIENIQVESESSIAVTANVAVELFKFGDLHFPGVALNIQGDNQSWQFHVDSNDIKGSVDLPMNDGNIKVDLSYLSVEVPVEEQGVTPDYDEQSANDDTLKVASVFSDVDTSELVAMDVSLDALHIGGKAWGRWMFEVVPIENGIHLKNLKATVRELNVGHKAPSQFYWTKSNGQNVSYFKGSIASNNVGDALVAWGQERLINSKKADFDISVQWLAEPDLVSLDNLNGDIKFDLSDGSFIRGAEAGENPLLRLIALFNFDTLARRLRLDFSDLAAKGFAYDRVYSEVNFMNGLATITEPLVVESSSSKMQMVGRIDLIEEDIEAQLVVTLPVANNLVVATAFLAGVPAGVGVYLVSKALGKTIDKASSVSYSVDGNWEDPKIKVRKVFDDTTETFSNDDFEIQIDTSVADGDAESSSAESPDAALPMIVDDTSNDESYSEPASSSVEEAPNTGVNK